MGTRRYRGPVKTVGQAVFADMPMQVVCQTCRHFRQMHAYELVQLIGKKADGRALPLFTPIAGLMWCRKCKRRETVTIFAPVEWV
jgi:hypothetical protein